VKNGRIGLAKTTYGFTIVSGELEMGESSSGHIVTAVKAKGRAVAEDLGSQLVLVDGPPGIGCPVIASVAGADYALAVTEPTPAARNSLDRMLSVLSHFNIPTSAVINRFDLNRNYAEEMKDYIQGKWAVSTAQMIPSDENVPISLSKRIPVVEYAPDCEASRSLVMLSDQIKSVI
jgi:MinD superfamily P-loop ATPase